MKTELCRMGISVDTMFLKKEGGYYQSILPCTLRKVYVLDLTCYENVPLFQEKHIKPTQLLRVIDFWENKLPCLGFHLYCKVEDIEKGKEILHQHFAKWVELQNKRVEYINNLYNQYKNGN